MNLYAIAATALAGLLTLVVEWLKLGQAQSTGAKLQAVATNAATATAQAAIAQAEVSAPTDKPAILDRLKAGSF